MKILDADHPFFIPVWRRWATVLVPVAWAIVEFSRNSPGWGVLFAGMAAWACWELLLKPKSDSK